MKSKPQSKKSKIELFHNTVKARHAYNKLLYITSKSLNATKEQSSDMKMIKKNIGQSAQNGRVRIR